MIDSEVTKQMVHSVSIMDNPGIKTIFKMLYFILIFGFRFKIIFLLLANIPDDLAYK